jgi:hypothetical protein
VSIVGGALSPQTGFKNRIINGAMTIDQRNAGASVTNIAGRVYPVDRFGGYGDQASKFTAQQSTVAPAGFVNSLLITSLSSYSVGSTEEFSIQHRIEGFNVADLGWGTANAQTVTISFWVRSSLTGTFGGSVCNGAFNRWYPFAYTISAANTWEQKTVTIAGDTSGTWTTGNGTGLQLAIGLGVGSGRSGSAGAWSSSTYISATGATSVVGTSGATFYITGVQLEKGSVATPFEFRSIGQELALCQRYFEQIYGTGYAFASVGVASITISTSGRGPTLAYKVTKRAVPTISVAGSYELIVGGTFSSLTAGTADIGLDSVFFQLTGTGFTAGQAVTVRNANDATAKITASAEL